MKKALKITAGILGFAILVILIFAIYIHFSGIPSYDARSPEFPVTADSISIANGKKLVTLTCAGCHTSENSNTLTGNLMEDESSGFGTIWAPNLNHRETGLRSYSDGQLAYLLRTGIKRNGQYAPPWMPKFPEMADEDLADIIAFLRSDHPSLAVSDKVLPPSQPSFLTKLLTHVAFKPFPYPEQKIQKPAANDQVALGKYLADGVLQCYSCHSADFKTNDDYQPVNSAGYYGGGNMLQDLDKNPVLSANITMHPDNGIGKWKKVDFVKAVKWGSRPDGSVVSTAMPKFTLLDDAEVEAIWEYLQTVPVIDNKVKP